MWATLVIFKNLPKVNKKKQVTRCVCEKVAQNSNFIDIFTVEKLSKNMGYVCNYLIFQKLPK
jgi:hypothetical protein